MTTTFVDDFSVATRLQPLQGAAWRARGIRVLVKREDERDAVLGGNKWCKLAGHLALARRQGVSRLVSMGGRWSNHLHALAHAGQRFGFETVGLVRGEAVMTPMLQDAQAAGMRIEFITREEYRGRNEGGWQQHVAARHAPCLVIPEGGSGQAAFPGLTLLASELEAQTSGPVTLAVPVGSGTTLAGLALALPSRFTVFGFQAFADAGVEARIAAMIDGRPATPWRLLATPAMRAHRALPAGLMDFLSVFEHTEGIPLDPVYTVRMLAQLQVLMLAGGVPDRSTVVVLHTGGLQGRRGHHLLLAA